MSHAILADFTTPPYFHQLREFELHCETPARALLWQMRTGKTKLCVDMACHLFKEGLIDTVLVIAPNGVHENWTRRELPKHHWHSVDRDTIAWRTDVSGTKGVDRVAAADRKGWQEQHDAWWARADRVLQTAKLAWFAFASSSMTRVDCKKLIAKIVKKRRVFIIFDEAHDFRTPGSKRSHMARALAKRCLFKRNLTASVITNTPLAAWAQYELLKPGCLGFTKYGDFKNHHATYRIENSRQGKPYPVLDEYKNLDELQSRLADWSSVVLRSDCSDLPALVRTPRRIEPTDEQLRVYRELHKQFVIELSDGQEVSIGENSTRLMKLQQVMSGFIIDEFKDLYCIPGPNPRLEAMSDEVYLSSGKVIVWCRFRQDMDAVVKRLLADGHKVLQYHGRTSAADKAYVREVFSIDSEENDYKVLVGYPTLGIDLSAADEIIWYSHTFDAILREQADERATVMCGANTRVTDLWMPGPDEYILENLANKVDIADAVAGTGLRDALTRMIL